MPDRLQVSNQEARRYTDKAIAWGTLSPTFGILDLTNNSDELFNASTIVGTRRLRGDIRKRQIKGFFKFDELPSYAFTGWPPDLPAAQYMVSICIDADTMHFDDAHAVIEFDPETFASVERFACNLPRRLR